MPIVLTSSPATAAATRAAARRRSGLLSVGLCCDLVAALPSLAVSLSVLVLFFSLSLTSCTADGPADVPAPSVAITFSPALATYEATTRSGAPATIDYSVLARGGYGFGVFAYGGLSWTNKPVTYTGSETTPPVPPLDPVHMHPGNWTYSGTTEYWPDKTVSFLAYAPFVAAPESNTPGITSLTGTGVDATTVDYTIGEKPSECVDLLWAVNETTKLPWLNTTIEKNPGGNVLLTFHHALAAIGFRAKVSEASQHLLATGDGTATGDRDGYRIVIESVSIEGTFNTSGTLNLNSTAESSESSEPSEPKPSARWTAATPTANKSLTVGHDELLTTLAWPTTDDDADDASTVMSNAGAGLTTTLQPLIAPNVTTGAEQCLMVVPDKAERTYTVSITWHVCSRHSGTPAHEFTKTFTQKNVAITLLPETKYYLDFTFTLRDVSVSVTAENWNTHQQDATIRTEQGTSASESLARRGHPAQP